MQKYIFMAVALLAPFLAFGQTNAPRVEVYVGQNCPHCDVVQVWLRDYFMPNYPDVQVDVYDITDGAVRANLEQRLAAQGQQLVGIPTSFVGNSVVLGIFEDQWVNTVQGTFGAPRPRVVAPVVTAPPVAQTVMQPPVVQTATQPVTREDKAARNERLFNQFQFGPVRRTVNTPVVQSRHDGPLYDTFVTNSRTVTQSADNRLVEDYTSADRARRLVQIYHRRMTKDGTTDAKRLNQADLLMVSLSPRPTYNFRLRN